MYILVLLCYLQVKYLPHVMLKSYISYLINHLKALWTVATVVQRHVESDSYVT